MLGEQLTLPIIIGAALIDSINPCVFGVLIFLIAFMTRVFKSRKKMLIGGLLYSAVVYATYLFLGFGILRLTLGTGIAGFFYLIVAVIAIIAGLLEIKDFFWYGRGFTLQMIPGAASRIKYYTKKIESLEKKNPIILYLTTAVLGVFVVLVELPCTGAPYFAILGLLAKGSYAEAVPLLMLYNLIFILPLLVVIGVSYFGTKSDKLETWRQKHKGLMRLVIGLFLIALGVFMLNSLPPIF
ncbi:MAG: hypothetical protein COV29_01495 [Candidatus Yanofskybacteria bacterium CG10_big_fil_rev_8_21_14_0_10_36_16]|uniref:Cytochrome C biogenesis protein transmembrane domain-containing protein n=1 Tax=Candidatus Yanofskybacteria bacterium CG10_big_fil_rev_8_21_14_0_10_36_16 TaxID=1975096 RepID=A0A2J0Q787_9BACT|nr:MAG: hypothetical protein COV29_01495 [Candidatus Yanofskybacteria bacterium CG10_big_fil_rev_8_21_14_0_10_36_16]